MPVEPGMEGGRKERGRVLAETVPDGSARSTTRKKGEGRVKCENYEKEEEY